MDFLCNNQQPNLTTIKDLPTMKEKKPRPFTKTDVVRIRCRLTDKTRWVSQAQAEGLTLSVWIREVLNDSANPEGK